VLAASVREAADFVANVLGGRSAPMGAVGVVTADNSLVIHADVVCGCMDRRRFTVAMSTVAVTALAG